MRPGDASAVRSGLAGVPLLPDGAPRQTRKDFASGAEVRWCPGCGDHAILATVQSLLPELGLRRENLVFVSGIGCSSRFPYYLGTYGMHSIHGRAPAIATGLATSRPDLSVWVVTGDGDALSIGGNHLVHALRRNVNLTILLFNNRIYGLTKGQYSPTSSAGTVTASTPAGSVDEPFDPVSLALGAEASFVARALAVDRAGLASVLRQAAEHRGAAFVEIYQNCPIFNDGAFASLSGRDGEQAHLVRLEHGRPVRFGPPWRVEDGGDGLGSRGVVRGASGKLAVVDVTAGNAGDVVVHDAHEPDPSTQFALSRLALSRLALSRLDGPATDHVPVGVFRSVRRPTYDDLVREQLDAAVRTAGGPATDDDLARLLAGPDPWTVG